MKRMKEVHEIMKHRYQMFKPFLNNEDMSPGKVLFLELYSRAIKIICWDYKLVRSLILTVVGFSDFRDFKDFKN